MWNFKSYQKIWSVSHLVAWSFIGRLAVGDRARQFDRS
jgi:hypothetical protein